MSERNLVKDLELCQKATKGPVKWQKFGNQYYLTGQYGMRPIIFGVVSEKKEMDESLDNEPHIVITHISNRDAKRDLLIPLDPNHPDSIFVEEAWEGWPHAIRRAMKAEAEIKRLRDLLETCARWFDKISSADGSGHADLGRYIRRELDRRNE